MTNSISVKIGDTVVWGREIPHKGVVIARILPGEFPYARAKTKFSVSHKWQLSDAVITGLKKHPSVTPDYSKLYNRKLARAEVSYVVLTSDGVLYWPKTQSLKVVPAF